MGYGSVTVFDPAQRAALKALLATRRESPYSYGQRSGESYGQRSGELSLHELRPEGWSALCHAAAVGVELVSGEDHRGRLLPPVTLLPEPCIPIVVIDRSAQGIRVSPAILQGDRELVLPGDAYVGRPVQGIAFKKDDRLIVGSLARSLDNAEQQFFGVTGAVEVPEADVDLFATGFLPNLRQKLELRVRDGVKLPEPVPPTLLCRVHFGDRRASVEWAYRYRIGERTHEVAAVPRVDDPPVRDPGAEVALAASVPHGPWRTTAPGGTAELQSLTLIGEP